ncbi:MAG: acyl-CoA reductase [Flavobacteriales bacterium]|jgi:hypothetical protein|nr:acyl-CoA reductase [Flavobacteriales bacterium]
MAKVDDAQGVEARIAALEQLGRVMAAIGEALPWPGHAIGLGRAEYGALDDVVRDAQVHNGWATEANVRHAFTAWAGALEGAGPWLAAYPGLKDARKARTVGLVLAGNVPLVGLHDVLCVVAAGHRAVVKCSSQEPRLLPALMAVLDRFLPGTAQRITFTTGKWGPVDAVIATGSTNTARYFEHYFGHLPRIVRKGRVGVAVLDGTETDAELAALGEDVFRYFGLGCRNVAKVHLPQDFDLDRLFAAFYPWHEVALHRKYGNNLDYHRALWLLDRIPFLENGFLLMREAKELHSPTAALHYERHADRAGAEGRLHDHADAVQCIVGHGHVPFGRSQFPALHDYADGVDTMRFLLGL